MGRRTEPDITSAMVKSPHPLMGLSTAARSALTAACKGLSREVARDNVTIKRRLLRGPGLRRGSFGTGAATAGGEVRGP